MPVINKGDFWLPDSDEIVKYLEKEVPSPSMASSVPADVTGSLFGAFRGFLMAKVGPDGSHLQCYVCEHRVCCLQI